MQNAKKMWTIVYKPIKVKKDLFIVQFIITLVALVIHEKQLNNNCS